MTLRLRRARQTAGGALFLTLLFVVALTGCSDDGATVTSEGPTEAAGDDGASAAQGTVRVRLEPRPDGSFFIEGFEVGLRFETTDGEVLATKLWTDYVAAFASPTIQDFYTAVLDQPVPAGQVVVRAQVTIGAGPPPSVPDLDGDLPCAVTVDIAAGETALVEVQLAENANCLRVADGAERDGERESGAELTRTSAPTDEVAHSGVYVDVDLVCRAFRLDGIWVLAEGDPSTWQPPGERHEGGSFVLDSPTTGTFRGDVAGTKVATFRLLADDESPACEPVPR